MLIFLHALSFDFSAPIFGLLGGIFEIANPVYLATPGFCAATQRREITLGLR
jgi:hypothetical protein